MDEQKLFRIKYTGEAYVYAEDEHSAKNAFYNDYDDGVIEDSIDIDSIKEC